MAPTQRTLPDQFELLHTLVRVKRTLLVTTVMSLVVAALACLALWTWATTPKSVVVWPDNPYAPAMVVKTGDVSVREVDAKRFFLHVTDALLGWSSTDVRDRFDDVSLLMNSEWRVHFNEELQKSVDVPEGLAAGGASRTRIPQLSFMITSKVRNEVLPIKLDDITCARVDVQWNCKATVKVKTHPLLGPPSNEPPRVLVVQASFKEYPVTSTAIWGLLVSYFEVLDKE